MYALFAGLTTLDIVHQLDHTPDVHTKTTSSNFALAAGGPATNAAVTAAALSAALNDGNPQLGPGLAPERSAVLLGALGRGTIGDLLRADVTQAGVEVLDAAEESGEVIPAVSSIIEHPDGRMVASTNARVHVHAESAKQDLEELVARRGLPGAVLVDGHNPELAGLALTVGTMAARGDVAGDPFAELEDRPSHLRVLDGGSWKPWFVPLLGFIDVAVVSADFHPPLVRAGDGQGVADFLKGFGIQRVVITHGPQSVEFWWDGAYGRVDVAVVEAVSTMGAGDVFHGALTWALARHAERGLDVPSDPSGLITFASAVAGLSVQSFGTRQWTTSEHLAHLARGW